MRVGFQSIGNAGPVEIVGALAAWCGLKETDEIFRKVHIQRETRTGHNAWRYTCSESGIGVWFEAFAVEDVWNAQRR